MKMKDEWFVMMMMTFSTWMGMPSTLLNGTG